MLSSRASLAAAIGAVALAGCSAGAGGGGGGEAGSNTVRVLMVNNPQMVDLQKLTAANFTKQTGINVEFKVLPENDVRDTIAQDVANQAGQYDVITISNLGVPFYPKNGGVGALNGSGE